MSFRLFSRHSESRPATTGNRRIPTLNDVHSYYCIPSLRGYFASPSSKPAQYDVSRHSKMGKLARLSKNPIFR